MKTKEELLKIYSAYLPYELKGKRTDGAKGDYILRAVYDDGSIIWKYDGFGNSTQIGVLPVLYSMDMLTKEIEHKGERFIPILKWCDIPDTIELIGVGYEKKNYYAKFGFEAEIVTYKIPSDIDSMNYYTVNKLLEWHFNVFGLDESEYIKKEIINER